MEGTKMTKYPICEAWCKNCAWRDIVDCKNQWCPYMIHESTELGKVKKVYVVYHWWSGILTIDAVYASLEKAKKDHPGDSHIEEVDFII